MSHTSIIRNKYVNDHYKYVWDIKTRFARLYVPARPCRPSVVIGIISLCRYYLSGNIILIRLVAAVA